jgi:uncharacterized membrane protein YeaQ/YmgE (transglycosylase-associated protein family)
VNIISWIIVGLIAGFLARAVLPSEQQRAGGCVGDLVSGIIGALVGGWLFGTFGWGGITGINPGSIIIAFIGAIIFLLVWRAITDSSRRSRM